MNTIKHSDFAPDRPLAAPSPQPRRRDERLDVWRGIGMLIILIAHIPGNEWTLWIPARFGFSDATEMFVFLSGVASAIAFGAVFDRRGLLLGSARIAHRVWQVYWSHVAVFVTIVALMALLGSHPNGQSYLSTLNLQHFEADPARLTAGLLTLTYVPNYFDILPMYLVILALIPAMMALERAHRFAPLAASIALWSAAQAGWTGLPAEPWSDRTWYFDPFGWQLLFFFGFFLKRGVVPLPGFRPDLVLLAAAVVVLAVPVTWFRLLDAVPDLKAAATALKPFAGKSHFGPLRLLHFMALAYLAYVLVRPNSRVLANPLARLVRTVGQQSLGVFMTGMVIAQALGAGLDLTDRGPLATATANLAGIAILIAVAHAIGWFKAAPWKAER